MNFLAHIYLSGDDEHVIVGNFLGDFVKGSDYLMYPDDIRQGILMHRNIDSFTDNHQLVRDVKNYFIPGYFKYAGVIVDILFDHYLAKDFYNFHTVSLKEFVNNAHNILLNHYELCPEKMKSYLPGFMKQRWLERYATLEGIRDVFDGMSATTSLPHETDFAMETIVSHYEELRHAFYDFFYQIVAYMEERFMVSISGRFS
jgi:acyl carrier protein phosphodiesterase